MRWLVREHLAEVIVRDRERRDCDQCTADAAARELTKVVIPDKYLLKVVVEAPVQRSANNSNCSASKRSASSTSASSTSGARAAAAAPPATGLLETRGPRTARTSM